MTSGFVSITHWVEQLKAGDRAAIQQLWNEYFKQLVGLARQKLQGMPRQATDEEDVALSAFHSFCIAVENGRFPRLEDRDDLWQILVMLTKRKAANLKQHQGRAKRDFRRLRLAVDMPAEAIPEAEMAFLDLIEGREPDPLFALEMAEHLERLLARLQDDALKRIVLRKLENYTNEEIALEMGCALSTIERRLRLIRKRWTIQHETY